MAKNPNQQQVVVKKCENCGGFLPVNDRGMPATSVYFNGHWLCDKCKFNKEAREKFK